MTLEGRGCKLDSTLVSVLVERWKPKKHTFHLPCDECTIILEDVQLQLGLPVDGLLVTGSAHATDWVGACGELLGLVPETIYGGQIEMSCLRRNFRRMDKDSIEVER